MKSLVLPQCLYFRQDSTVSSIESNGDNHAYNYETDDSIKLEYENIVNRYEQVVEDTFCLFCNTNFESVDEFNRHVVENHIWRR